MKRTVSILLCIAMIFALCACGGKQNAAENGESSSAPSASSSLPSVFSPKKDEPEEEEPVPEEPKGSVRFMNGDSRIEARLNELAKQYTQETGVAVEINTVAGDYDSALSAALDSGNAPTVFTVNKNNFSKWEESCLALNDSEAAAKCLSAEFGIMRDDVMLAVAYDYDAFGIGVNSGLLENAGFAVSQISSYAMLVEAVDTIQYKFLGDPSKPAAFAEAQLSDELWRYSRYCFSPVIFFECNENNITEQPAYMRADFIDNFRQLYELWFENSVCARWHLDGVTPDTAKTTFAKGKAVFYPCGSWELDDLVSHGANAANLSMIPLYMQIRNEEDYGMVTANVRYWSVNRECDDLDIEATLDFLYYIVTDPELAKIAAMPFEGQTCANPFLAAANELLAAGKRPEPSVADYVPGEEWEANVMDWLIKYTTGYGDWVQFSDAFIVGWEGAYSSQHKF